MDDKRNERENGYRAFDKGIPPTPSPIIASRRVWSGKPSRDEKRDVGFFKGITCRTQKRPCAYGVAAGKIVLESLVGKDDGRDNTAHLHVRNINGLMSCPLQSYVLRTTNTVEINTAQFYCRPRNVRGRFAFLNCRRVCARERFEYPASYAKDKKKKKRFRIHSGPQTRPHYSDG